MHSMRVAIRGLIWVGCLATVLCASPAFAQCNFDGLCDPGETCQGCAVDCGACCPDGMCDFGETCTTCTIDCGPCCPNGACDYGENCSTCALDCGACCPNGACDFGENCSTCASDCGSCCPNGACDYGENCSTCASDCGSCCPNGACDYGETCATCPADCPCAGCPNGSCGAGENCSNCPADCGPCCPNGACDHGETCGSCPADCPCASCPNGVCEPALGENRTSCAADCSDFYVRDWTDSAAVHDTGAEPSTDATFYDSSDVWSRTTNAAGAFVSDVPVNEDPVRTPGHNYGFVRVHRNAAAPAGSASVTVNAELFRAQAGLGPNFVSIGSTTLSFAPADVQRTLSSGVDWTLPNTASGHMCFAVEISAPGDLAKAPSILGGTAGAGMMADNNKAQRNMTVSTVPAPAPAPAPPLPSGAKKMTFFAIVHNALVHPRTMTVRYRTSPDALDALGRAEVAILGGARQALGHAGELLLPKVMPGENRWLALTVDVPTREVGKPLAVHFVTDADTPAASGFTFVIRQAPVGELWRENARRHEALLKRLDALGLPARAEVAGEAAFPADARVYGTRVRLSLPRLNEAALGLVRQAQTGAHFQVAEDLAALRTLAAAGSETAMAVVHARVLSRMEAALTARELAEGDEADILQTVRWQMSLIPRLGLGERPFIKAIQKRSAEFAAGYVARKLTIAAYPQLVMDVLPGLRDLVAQLGQRAPALREDLRRMEANLGSPKRLQGAHRQMLLRLQALVK